MEPADVEWRSDQNSRFQLEVRGDKTVVRWLQGLWQCQHPELLGVSASARPRELGAGMVRHVSRELTQDADALASGGEARDLQWTERLYEVYQLHVDVSFQQDRCAEGAGWVLEGAPCRPPEARPTRRARAAVGEVGRGSQIWNAAACEGAQLSSHEVRVGRSFVLFHIVGACGARVPKIVARRSWAML